MSATVTPAIRPYLDDLGWRTASVARVALAICLLASLSACSVQLGLSTFCRPDPGEIAFGRDLDASNTAVDACSNTFKQQGDFAFVGIFPRRITGSVVMEVSRDGGAPTQVGGFVFSTPGDYYSGRWHLNAFPGPGTYVVSMTFNGETLASGTFTLAK